ncbi:hypothetical protein [Sphingosinicella sp. BN140058]|uniref:hypothetical protein n=1 Tax=Sphingosinicella sp. BN140058 TaxID=1892855 RepID=UPI0010132BE0|nr:hypothetical protein [Sphingosinicella sp. BN140058]QAY75403.1 hypothetical protein ETR14_01820 [Sphingosinicella sp. BN140058]
MFLEGIASEELALHGLCAEFPDQAAFSTKVVFDPDGKNAIGWLYVGEEDEPDEQLGPFLIQADYSGRHWNFDAKEVVVEALRRVQARIGGELRDYGN